MSQGRQRDTAETSWSRFSPPIVSVVAFGTEPAASNARMLSFNSNLLRAIHLTREMLALADDGDRDRVDDSCGIIYGVLRDAAYRVRKLAEQECAAHKESGKWEEPGHL